METLPANDDGFDAHGIQVLYRVLSTSDGFEVAVCAPERECST
jgi:broad specificity polyphosphatase/5'/3'-nucleotidase SurE